MQAAKKETMVETAGTQTSSGGSFEEFQRRRVFSSLDGIRCIAVTAVIWHHTHGSLKPLPLMVNGMLGVDFFFVLSGFLIVTLLLRERRRSGAISLRNFYVRRTLRIFPLYYGVLAALAFGLFVLQPQSGAAQAFPGELLFYLTYTSNLVEANVLWVAWSLAAEEQFYLLWPPIEKWLGRWGRRVVVPVILVGLLVNQLFNFNVAESWIGEIWGPEVGQHIRDREIAQATFTPILLGVLLAHCLDGRRGYAWFRAAVGRPGAALVLALVTLIAANTEGDITGFPRLTIQLLMTLFLASVVIQPRHELSALLEWAPIRRVGIVSYGCYLLHAIVIIVLDKVTDLEGGLVRFVLTFALTMAAAEISFRFFESPFLKLKARFSS